MLRVLTLTLALAVVVPLSPFGCPPGASAPDDLGPIERPTLAVAIAPVAPQTVGQTVTLQATVAGGSELGTVSYAWLQTAGPGVPLQSADQSVATFTAPSLQTDQTLTFMVTVWSDSGGAGRSETSVQVAADPNYGQSATRPSSSTPPVLVGPAADAGDGQTVKPGDTVTLDGSGSRGEGLRFRWHQVSGTPVELTGADTVTATFTAPAYGAGAANELVFELSVSDEVPRTVSDRVIVKVRDPSLSDRAVVIATSLGEIRVELEVEKAPISVANFLQYVDDGFYDGTIFHRVIPGFVIQGGGYTPGLKEKKTRDPIENEADNGLSNVRGTLAMARLNDPDTATSQFFVNVANNVKDGDGKSDLDPGGVSPDGYAVFGHVTEGLDVIDRIAAVETGEQSGFQDVPVEDVIIQSIRRAPAAQVTQGEVHELGS